MYTFKQIWEIILSEFKILFPPTILPEEGKTQVTLFDIIKQYNAPMTGLYPRGIGPAINAQIGQNDEATNHLVADLITTVAKQHNMPELYLAACIMQESRFSPTTFNHNLSKSNLTPSFEKTDWGMCQMSGTYLPSKPGMEGLTKDEMAAKAQDPKWAVPTMGNVMAGNLASATALLDSKSPKYDNVLADAVKKLNTTTLTDEQWYATLAYNRGFGSKTNTKGGAYYYVTNDVADRIKHPFMVAHWYDLFNKAENINPDRITKDFPYGFEDHISR